MADESFQERTEEATAKKRDDVRQKGQVMRSVELNSAFALVFGLLILYAGGSAIVQQCARVARETFIGLPTITINRMTVQKLFVEMVGTLMLTIAPVVLGLLAVGVAANALQSGFHFSLEALQPQWGRVNPLSGIRKVFFSARSMVEMTKNLFKVVIVGFIAYTAVDSIVADSLPLVDGDVGGVLGFIARSTLKVGLRVGLAFLVLAVFDYLYQRFQFEKDIRMTKQEVKEEAKMNEGDPLIKSRIKTIQRQIAYKRMMHDVPKADVVVTNPTHFAVALKYEAGAMVAPKVVAKGADYLAQRIKKVAAEHHVPLVEDKLLARSLYKSVDVGEYIPEKLFQAVAQVMAYIYRLKAGNHGFGVN